MRPDTFYLYEYNGKAKLKNTGFLKLTRRYHSCMIQINARGISVSTRSPLTLFVFYMEDDTACAFPLKEIPCAMRALSVRFSISDSQFPEACSADRTEGFLLQLSDGSVLAAVSPGIVFDSNRIRLPEETPPDNRISDTEPVAEENDTEPAAETAEDDDYTEPAAEATTEAPAAETAAETAATENENASEVIHKIHRSDMQMLPRKYWTLANNSFLLHGYHNYHHLLLIEKDGDYWLGVPGVYDTKEARAAELFGFPQFSDTYNSRIELSEEECESDKNFGYWFRYIMPFIS